MSSAKVNSKTKTVPINPVGTTVWGRFEVAADTVAPSSKLALANKSPAKSAAAKKAPVKRVSGPVTVTVFDTPLRPRHATRATLAAAARSVK